MSICEQKPDCDLTQKLLYLKNGRTAYFSRVARLNSKIETCIFDLHKVEKILCLKEKLAAVLEKLKVVNERKFERKSRRD